MPTLKEILAEKESRLDNVPDALLTEVQKAQKTMLGELSKLMDRLDTEDGKILLTKKNLGLIETIGSKLQEALMQGEYIGAVKDFAKQFPGQADLSNQYFKKVFGDDFEDEKIFQELVKNSQQQALKLLDTDAVQATFIEPLKDVLRSSVTTGSSFAQTVQTLTNFIQGTPELDGKLLKYVKQVSYDGFAIADRQYTKAVGEQLGIEWYRYSGGTISDTREFCKDRHGKYFHKKEIEKWGDIKQWQGRRDGTNDSTIFAYAGGYNCKHSILPVSIEVVPKSDIDRNIKNGNYKPEK